VKIIAEVQRILSKSHFVTTPALPKMGFVGDAKFMVQAARSTRPWWLGMPPRMVKSSLGHILNSSVVVWKDIPGGVPDLPADMADHIDHIVERLPR